MRTVAAVMLPIIAVLVGCGEQLNPELKDIGQIQQLARITIPSSARNVRCAGEHGIDSLVYGRFDIPAADLALVLAGIPAGEREHPFDGYSNVTSHKMRETWWQPQQVKEPKVANWSTPGFSINLLFGATGEPDVATVYFYNFSM